MSHIFLLARITDRIYTETGGMFAWTGFGGDDDDKDTALGVNPDGEKKKGGLLGTFTSFW